jgi:hypothetical protein
MRQRFTRFEQGSVNNPHIVPSKCLPEDAKDSVIEFSV